MFCFCGCSRVKPSRHLREKKSQVPQVLAHQLNRKLPFSCSFFCNTSCKEAVPLHEKQKETCCKGLSTTWIFLFRKERTFRVMVKLQSLMHWIARFAWSDIWRSACLLMSAFVDHYEAAKWYLLIVSLRLWHDRRFTDTSRSWDVTQQLLLQSWKGSVTKISKSVASLKAWSKQSKQDPYYVSIAKVLTNAHHVMLKFGSSPNLPLSSYLSLSLSPSLSLCLSVSVLLPPSPSADTYDPNKILQHIQSY